MADEQICEEGSTIALLAIGPYDNVWLQISGKYKPLEKIVFVLRKTTTWRLYERKNDLARIRIRDPMRTSLVRYHRTNTLWDVLVLVYFS
jgi:hypothetical protein